MELSTDYMGLALRNPLVASPSPLSKTVDAVRQLADAGVGALEHAPVVVPPPDHPPRRLEHEVVDPAVEVGVDVTGAAEKGH